jgi:hypothetical protein
LQLQSIEDIKSLRLTCAQTGQALATEVLRRITVNINVDTYERELSKLQYLASATKRSPSILAIQGIRQLDIESLSPALNPREPWACLDSERDADAAEELEYYEEELKKCLYKALSSLTTVKTVRWVPAAKDSEWAHTIVMNAIKSFPNLQNLSVELQNCRIEVPFHFFTTLRHISVFCVGEDLHRPAYHTNSFQNLTKMIAQSPLLESIDFTNSYNYKRKQVSTRSLHQLFERYPEESVLPSLQLKRLSLASCLVSLDDDAVMRHLKHLTSLSLEDLLEPMASPTYSDTDSDSDSVRYHNNKDSSSKAVLEKQHRWGSSYEDTWRAIRNAGLKLEEIYLSTIPLTFLEYIGSYSGLKKLTICTGGFKDGIASDSAGKNFFKALEKHASSIEELDINAYYEGLWCFGHHNKALLSTFHNLKILNVKVRSSDLVPGSEDQDIIKVLIDTVVIHIPQLQSLSASIADSEFDRHNMCGMDSYFRSSRYNQKIVSRILKYQAPWSCKQLPVLTVNSPIIGSRRIFVGLPVQESEGLRYEDISSPTTLEYPENVDSTDSESDED